MRELPTGTVTLLFIDIEGPTQLLQAVGERYTEVLDTCQHLLRTTMQELSGHEGDKQGDSSFFAFAHAINAVSAAVAAQRALAAHAWPQGVRVRVRMGLHTSEPQPTAEGYVGLDVQHAARIMRVGHAGQVLLSQRTRQLVEHTLPQGVSIRDLGQHRLKDLLHPSHLYQLVIDDLPANFLPLDTLDSHPHNLPVQPTPLIGREREIAAVQQLLEREDVRLLTLTGPAGSGKTRLGLQVAAEHIEEYADGVFFVNLAPVSDSALVFPALAQVLGIKEIAGQPLLNSLSTSLHQKELLLLLDNFEQVLEAASQVAALLESTPRLKMLVTSRAVLHVRAEQEFAVPPLAIPDSHHLPDLVALSQYEAVALFIARARAVQPDFQLTTLNAQAVAEICVHLDGLPLAIELAAARITLLPPQALLARLGQRFALLTGGAQDAPRRQQTLHNTLAWSYDLLNAAEQRLLRRLSVFVGGATQEAIEALYRALGEEPGQILDGIASLIDQSLLRRSEQEAVEPRFVMLETIRAYGREMLTAHGEMEATCRAHALYYVRLAEAAELAWGGPQEAEWMKCLQQEHDNLLAALGWLLEREEAELALRLGAALWWFWFERYSFHEGWQVLERALEGGEAATSPVRAKALWAAGSLASFWYHSERAEALCQESLGLYRAGGDVAGMGTALFHLAMVALNKGDFTTARTRFEESIALNRDVGNQNLVAFALECLAEMDLQQGEYARALQLLEESLTLYRAGGNMSGCAVALHSLTAVLLMQGDLVQAQAVAEECLALVRKLGMKLLATTMLAMLGEIARLKGDTATARLLFEQVCAYYREVADEGQLAWALSRLARAIATEGDLTKARALYEQSLMGGKGANSDLSWADLPQALEGLAAVVAA